MDDDKLDTEALQAQIDLSMSYAHDLISSWVKPVSTTALKSRHDTDKELKEYMRRPPRLGVGAPIPESAISSHETARLKSRLINTGGKKRARTDEDDTKTRPSGNDDEEESRTGAIRKKAKPDPFANGIGNKKNMAQTIGLPTPQTTPVHLSTAEGMVDDIEQTAQVVVNLSATSPETTKASPKKKRRKLVNPGAAITRYPPISSRLKSIVHVSSTPPEEGDRSESLQTPAPSPSGNRIASQRSSEVIDVSRTRLTSTIPLNFTLLNLDGPPNMSDSDEDDGQVQGESPSKRKRRRRRKKKISIANGTIEISSEAR